MDAPLRLAPPCDAPRSKSARAAYGCGRHGIDLADQASFSDTALTAALAAVTADARTTPEPSTIDEAAARLARLSDREREVLNGLVEGGTNKSIALRLGLSPRTVELYRGQVMAKLDAANLAELLHHALSAGLRPSRPRG